MKHMLLLIAILIIHSSSIAQVNTFENPVGFDKHLKFAVNNDALLDSLKEPITGFYESYNGNILQNDYWHEDDSKEFFTPFINYLAYLHARDPKSLYPYVMSLTPDSITSDYVAKVAIIRSDSVVALEKIYYLVVSKNKDGVYKLRHPRSYLTRNWKHYDVGSVHFVVNPEKEFNVTEAQKLDSFSKSIAAYFHIEPISFTYYSCGYLNNLYLPQGEDNFFMTGDYTSTTGGNAVTLDSVVYSGNNSEYYPHELTHIYVSKLAKSLKVSTSWMAAEGICTYFGGSVETPLEEHLKILANYTRKKDLKSIKDIMNIPGGQIGDTDVVYTTCGLMAKLIDEKEGYKGLIEFANITQPELYTFVANTLGVDQQNIDSYLMKELLKY